MPPQARARRRARPRTLLLTLEVYADDEGNLSAQVDSPGNDLSEADAARVIGVIADQLDPDRDRADEVQAWGAGRRKRV